MFSRLSPFFFFFFFFPLFISSCSLFALPTPFTDLASLTWRDVEYVDRQFLHLFFFFLPRIKNEKGNRGEGETYSRIRKGGKCAYVGDKRNDKTKKQGRGLFEKFRNICLLWILFYDSFLGNGKGEIDFSRNFMVGVIQTG